MPTTIKLKNSVTTTNVPSSLAQGEVAINVTDKKVWVGNAATTPVQLLGTGSDGSFTNLTVSGTTALNGGTTLGDASGDALTINSSAVSIPNGLNFDSNTFVIDATNNNVGVGTASPLGKLHASSGSFGGTVTVNANQLIAESSGNGGITIATGATSLGNIFFADSGDTADGFVQYDQSGRSLRFGTATAERMRITSTGDVVVGSSSALGGGKFSLITSLASANGVVVKDSATSYGNTNNFVLLQNSTAVTVGALTHPAANSLGVWGNDDIRFLTSGSATERMRIDSSGNVGIGTSSPTEKLDVAGNIAITGTGNLSLQRPLIPSAKDQGSPQIAFKYYSTGTTYTTGAQIQALTEAAWSSTSAPTNMVFYTVPSGSTTLVERMRIDSAGNLGLGVTPSAWSVGKAIQVGSSGDASLLGFSNSAYLTANAYFSSGWYYTGTTYATMYEQNSGIHKWLTAPSGTAGNAITFTQAMTLDASGRLLIGRTSDNSSFGGGLQLEGNTLAFQSIIRYSSNAAGAPALYLGRSKSATVGTNTIVASGDSLGSLIFTGANGTGYSDAASIGAAVDGNPGASADMPGRLVFSTSADGSATPTERMRIDSSGSLLVGMTTTGGIGVSVLPDLDTGGSINVRKNAAASGARYVIFDRSGTQIGAIAQNGTTGVSYQTSSDYRLKENIAPMTGALAKVTQLKPCTYTWKADGSNGQGFIAHELQAVVPECVIGEKDAVNEDGSIKPQGIDTSFLVATLTAAIQELKAEVDSLKAQLNK
jgi:hypothetical protein